MSQVSLEGPLAPARFVERPNRFLVRCRLEGTVHDAGRLVEAHLPDPGRLSELLVADARLRLRPADSPSRKTDWTVVLAERPGGDGWVSVDTTLPNRLLLRALREDALPELGAWELDAVEVSVGSSRFDFVLIRRDANGDSGLPEGPDRLVLEVKSVTLMEEGVGLFPDAVTARGTRHVRELGELTASGEWEAVVLFLVQRDDARAVMAAPSIDPDFAAALEEAREKGVRVLARRCRVDQQRVRLGARIPVRGPGEVEPRS